MPSSEFMARLFRRMAAWLAGVGRTGEPSPEEGLLSTDEGEQPETEGPRSFREWTVRALVALSAVLAAFMCAALLFNYLIMPIVVRQGDTVIVPDLVGIPSIAAERVADRAGLRSRVDTERPDPEAPVGTVVAQTPQAGTEVKRGRTVALALSSGIDMRRLPRLAGLNARQAQLDAEQAGFAVSEAIEVHTDHVERGRVIGT
ncbi:MAG: PASTA domain-containing protein, partial [Candidatus Eisenbacteria bacterium]|nr:PASTA domain-containing protein [Candidatus Eisenbacteria bacterium]